MLRGVLLHTTGPQSNVQFAAARGVSVLVQSLSFSAHSCLYSSSSSSRIPSSSSRTAVDSRHVIAGTGAQGWQEHQRDSLDLGHNSRAQHLQCTSSNNSNLQQQPVAAAFPASQHNHPQQQQQQQLPAQNQKPFPSLLTNGAHHHTPQHWRQELQQQQQQWHQWRWGSSTPWHQRQQQQQQQQWRCASTTAGDDPADPTQNQAAAAAAADRVQQQQRQQQQQAFRGFAPLISLRQLQQAAPNQQQQQQQPPDTRVAPARLYPLHVGEVTLGPSWPDFQQTTQQQQQQQQQQQAAAAVHRTQSEQQQQQQHETQYPVYAVHLAGEIDYSGFVRYLSEHRENFGQVLQGHSNHVLLQLEDLSENEDLLRYNSSKGHNTASFVVIYRYGSVIFSNVRPTKREEYLNLLKQYVKVPKGQELPQDFSALRSDEATIVVRENLASWSKLEPDKIVVQTLDVGNLRVISTVLSQSVALDYFNSRVDAAIQQFTPYLTAVAQTGQCDTVKEAGLLQLIADNSLLYTDVVTKIGLLDISQTAWNQDRHFELWSALRSDYEIDRRFDAINRKLGPMLENAKFLLDVRAEQKSSGAEWIIIFLIMLEVVMNGFGHLATFYFH